MVKGKPGTPAIKALPVPRGRTARVPVGDFRVIFDRAIRCASFASKGKDVLAPRLIEEHRELLDDATRESLAKYLDTRVADIRAQPKPLRPAPEHIHFVERMAKLVRSGGKQTSRERSPLAGEPLVEVPVADISTMLDWMIWAAVWADRVWCEWSGEVPGLVRKYGAHLDRETRKRADEFICAWRDLAKLDSFGPPDLVYLGLVRKLLRAVRDTGRKATSADRRN
jgi:hypothetical protein